MPMIIVTAMAALLIAWFVGQPHWREHQRRRLRARPFPEAWHLILKRRMPVLRTLPADLQHQLRQHVQVFLAEKAFIGCAGLAITDDVRVTIAAQACLLILNRERTDYYPGLRQILVYPGAFVVDQRHTDETGTLHSHHRAVLSGESWDEGQVILSWQDAIASAAIPDDAYNVVIHEFAHQLDQQTGQANGTPALPSAERHRRWSRVMDDAFQQLRQSVGRNEDSSVLDPYGASDPVEFFAVASEAFFERPVDLADAHPGLYQELRDFYRVDPASWAR